MKRFAEAVLTRSGAAAVARRLVSDRVLILAYHNIVPSQDPLRGEASLHLPLEDFQQQLDHLQDTFEIVPLGELDEARPRRGRGVAVLTFDDAYRGALELGLGELASRGLPATVFACPGRLGKGPFWWDLLADPESGVLHEEARHEAMVERGGRHDQVLAWADQIGLPRQALPPLYETATREELEAASAHPGFAVGSHSWSHANLTAVPPEVLEDEIRASGAFLEELDSGAPELFSYPYGAWNEAVARAIEAAGVRRAVTVRGGLTRLGELPSKPFSLPRMNVPRGLSAEGFLLRISGVRPR